MRNNISKRLVSQLTIIALIFGLVCGIAPAPIKANAATAAWTLTSEKVGICKGYINGSNYESHDLIYGDGTTQVTSGYTRSADGYQARTYTYLGKTSGGVKFLEKGGYVGPDKPDTGTSDNYSECSIPSATYAAGGTVTLKIHTWSENIFKLGMTTRRVAAIGPSGAGYTGSKGTDMKDSDGKTSFDQNSTNPNTQYSWKPIKGEATITVTGTMPQQPKEGDTCTIYYVTDAGQYEWNYTYKVTSDPVSVKAPGKVTITTIKNNAKKTILVKYKVNGKVSGYQVQCADNKKFKKSITKVTTSKSIKVKSLKKGKTYYVRVRAFNTKANGSKLYGKWSATKNVKVKK